ncbi:MAG TPA: sigma-E factor negative regulatory protein [Gammaproteobacteria bacterium]|nr:sigma-E factor negative regulatory protein [Gammaproteobacteria bacterium]
MNTIQTTIREQLSALADGELDTAQARLLLARMARDPALRAAWARYHLTGDAMRGALADHHAPKLAEQVMAAIETDASPAQARRMPRWLKPVAGTAVAASVATLAVFSLQQQSGPLPAEVVPPVASTPAATIVPTLQGKALQSNALQNQVRTAAWGAPEPASKRRLAPYLEQHNRYATQRSIQGMLPYAHIVVFEPNKETANPDINTAGQTEKMRLERD